jgi:hypothetical protein
MVPRRPDAQRARLGRAVDLDRLAVEPDGPAVGLMHPGEDLHKGALAGTVLPDQRVDLAGPEIQRHVIKGLRGREPLRDPLQLGARRGRSGRSGRSGRKSGHR